MIAVEHYKLAQLEWTAVRPGQGAGYMGTGVYGWPYPACPVCRGLKPTSRARSEWVAEAIGHKKGCWLGDTLNALR